MVVSSFAAKKLWKSVRVSGKAMKRKFKSVFLKRRRNKTRKDVPQPLELQYPFSDDDDIDSIMRKKLRRFNAKLMACVFGPAEIERGCSQFIYVTDLYASTLSKPTVAVEQDLAENNKSAAADGASGSGSGDAEMKERDSGEPAMKQKDKSECLLLQNEKMKGIDGLFAEVDANAERFIAKVHEEMRLERQKSIMEYQEMLERGAS